MNNSQIGDSAFGIYSNENGGSYVDVLIEMYDKMTVYFHFFGLIIGIQEITAIKD